MGYIIFIIVLWVIFGFVVASMAKARGRDASGYVLLGVFISPLLAMIILLIQGDSDEKRLEKIEEEEEVRSSSKIKYKISTNAPLISDTTKYENLERLGNLLGKGIITKEEFDIEKKRLLSDRVFEDNEDEANLESSSDTDETSTLPKIQREIIKTKGSFLGVFNTKLAELLDEACLDKMHAICLLKDYKKMYGNDLIESICDLSSNYETIKHYLAPLIDKEIIEDKYPHKRII